MKKKTTIYEIAKQANVSITTVSRVVNRNPLVSEATRARVQEVIDRNHFSPNELARGLSISQSKTIGVILPDISNPYFSSLFLEIERYALEQNYSVVLYNSLYGSFSRSFPKTLQESSYFQMILDKRLDGVILTGGQLDKDIISEDYLLSLKELEKEIPVVIIGQHFPGTNCTFIQRNLEQGILTLLQHLHTLGHKKIGFIGGEPGVRITSERFETYKKTIHNMGLAFDESYVHFSDYYTPHGYSAMQEQLKTKMPTALIAINDMVALGAIRAAHDAGLQVPDDIAVVSCDEFYFAEYCSPRITSLHQQNKDLGRFAMVSLISRMKGLHHAAPQIHTPKLMIRESCGAPLGVRSFS